VHKAKRREHTQKAQARKEMRKKRRGLAEQSSKLMSKKLGEAHRKKAMENQQKAMQREHTQKARARREMRHKEKTTKEHSSKRMARVKKAFEAQRKKAVELDHKMKRHEHAQKARSSGEVHHKEKAVKHLVTAMKKKYVEQGHKEKRHKAIRHEHAQKVRRREHIQKVRRREHMQKEQDHKAKRRQAKRNEHTEKARRHEHAQNEKPAKGEAQRKKAVEQDHKAKRHEHTQKARERAQKKKASKGEAQRKKAVEQDHKAKRHEHTQKARERAQKKKASKGHPRPKKSYKLPIQIPPGPAFRKSHYLGCFKEGRPSELKIGHHGGGSCVDKCMGYKYFGIRGKDKCWCGQTFGYHETSRGCSCDGSGPAVCAYAYMVQAQP